MTRFKPAIIAIAVAVPLLAAAGCATQEEMSALRTEVTTTQDIARAAQPRSFDPSSIIDRATGLDRVAQQPEPEAR